MAPPSDLSPWSSDYLWECFSEIFFRACLFFYYKCLILPYVFIVLLVSYVLYCFYNLCFALFFYLDNFQTIDQMLYKHNKLFEKLDQMKKYWRFYEFQEKTMFLWSSRICTKLQKLQFCSDMHVGRVMLLCYRTWDGRYFKEKSHETVRRYLWTL